MAAPSPNRPSNAELIIMLADGRTATDIASELGVSKSVVCRWARAAGIELPHRSPYTSKVIACPYSAAALHEMYWANLMSRQEIGALASQQLGIPISGHIVGVWLAASGIKTKKPHEWLKARSAKNPQRWRDHGIAMSRHRKPMTEAQRQAAANNLRRWQKAGVIAAANIKRNRETRYCVQCGVAITKSPSQFHVPVERTCCSVACSVRNRPRVKKGSKANRPPVKLESRQCCSVDCGAIITKRPCDWRKIDEARTAWYCGKSCQVVAQNKLRMNARLEIAKREHPGQKQCGKCRKWLSFAEFTRDSTQGDGLRWRCRDCSANAKRLSRTKAALAQFLGDAAAIIERAS